MTRNSLFAPESYLDVRKALLEASTLAPECYTPEEFYQRELECIFLQHWQFVGREEQLSEPEQFYCCDGIGGLLIIMRAGDGLKAFANSCRHRAVEQQWPLQRILCPYHSWAYRLDGKLSRAPGMAEVVVLAGTDSFLAFEGYDCGFEIADGALVHINSVFRDILWIIGRQAGNA